jgi:hypothetical protein
MVFVVTTLVTPPVKHLGTTYDHVLTFWNRIEQTGLKTETRD